MYRAYYREVYPENGIRTIYGRSGADSITILERLIEKIKAKYYVDERWITTKRMEALDRVNEKWTPKFPNAMKSSGNHSLIEGYESLLWI